MDGKERGAGAGADNSLHLTEEKAARASATPKARILVIDDEKAIIDIMRINLEMRGYSVAGCFDSTQALDKAVVEKPDLIILDLLMPEKNGWEVLKELKENEVTRDIPVILCSVMKQGQVKDDVMQCGAADYLAKPFDSVSLMGAIDGALNPN